MSDTPIIDQEHAQWLDGEVKRLRLELADHRERHGKTIDMMKGTLCGLRTAYATLKRELAEANRRLALPCPYCNDIPEEAGEVNHE